uniref:zinc finger domain-containing protein n=1 Tax=Hymenobacter fodinae TaxID=2510796 RepID=UPI00374396A4
MRATPSPTCRTVPTSSSSASVLKLDSCSRRMADTSSGRTSAMTLIVEIGRGSSRIRCAVCATGS